MVEVYESMFNRSVEEFNKSHIDNALNVPYMFITEEGQFVSFLFIILLIHFCFIRQPKPKTKRDYDSELEIPANSFHSFHPISKRDYDYDLDYFFPHF